MNKKANLSVADTDFINEGFFENGSMQKSMELLTALAKTDLRRHQTQLMPMASSFFNPLGGIFLLQISDLKLLRSESKWLVRDGRGPLTTFFEQHPKPGRLTSKLLVDEDLAGVIPKAWEDHCGTYRVLSQRSSQPLHHAILLGLVAESYCSLPNLRAQMKDLRSRPALTNIDRLDFYLPARSWRPLDDEAHETFHAEFYREIFEVFAKVDAKSISRRMLLSLQDLSSTVVTDLNEKLLLADNSLVHSLLSRGARLSVSPELATDERYIELSPYHGYAVRTSLRRVSRRI